MKNKLIITFLLLASVTMVFGQQVGIGTDSPHASAILELDVSDYATNNKKGFLPPRMTGAQRDAIPSPRAEGLTIYNTTTNCLNAWNGSAWVSMCPTVLPDNKINILNNTSTDYNGSIYVYYKEYFFPIATCPLRFNGVTTSKTLTSFNQLLCRGEIQNVSIPAGGNINVEVTGSTSVPFLPTETRGKILNVQVNMTTVLDDTTTLLNSSTTDLIQTNNVITHFILNTLTQADKEAAWQ